MDGVNREVALEILLSLSYWRVILPTLTPDLPPLLQRPIISMNVSSRMALEWPAMLSALPARLLAGRRSKSNDVGGRWRRSPCGGLEKYSVIFGSSDRAGEVEGGLSKLPRAAFSVFRHRT